MAHEKNSWLVFIMSQPGKSPTPRIRLWRLLKGLGAAVLRDGVYLLPYREPLQQALEEQVSGVQFLGGAASLLAVEPITETDAQFRALFDRSADYATLLTATAQFRTTFAEGTEAPARRQLQQLWREHAAIVAIDYFPGPAQAQSAQALAEALTMTREEQARRMGAMRAVVAEFNAYRWVVEILTDAAHLRANRELHHQTDWPAHSIPA